MCHRPTDVCLWPFARNLESSSMNPLHRFCIESLQFQHVQHLGNTSDLTRSSNPNDTKPPTLRQQSDYSHRLVYYDPRADSSHFCNRGNLIERSNIREHASPSDKQPDFNRGSFVTVNRIRPDPLRTVGNFGTESSFGSLSDIYRRTANDPWDGVGEVRAEMARRYQCMRLFRTIRAAVMKVVYMLPKGAPKMTSKSVKGISRKEVVMIVK